MRGDERERDELDMDFLKWKRGLLLLGVMRTIMMRAICRPFFFFLEEDGTYILVEFLSTLVYRPSS